MPDLQVPASDIQVDANGVTVSFDLMQYLRGRAPDTMAVVDLLSGPPPLGRALPDPIQALKNLLSAIQETFKLKFPFPALADVGSTVPPPPDPIQVLGDIVNAINTAESKLNEQNFVISGGSVEAKLNLGPAGVTVNFSLTPKPYS